MILSGRRIGGGVGADGKLADGKSVMMEKDIVLNITPSLGRILKIAAAVIHYPALFKDEFQIPELQAV